MKREARELNRRSSVSRNCIMRVQVRWLRTIVHLGHLLPRFSRFLLIATYPASGVAN